MRPESNLTADHPANDEPQGGATQPDDEQASYRREYELQMRRLACPSCGEEAFAG